MNRKRIMIILAGMALLALALLTMIKPSLNKEYTLDIESDFSASISNPTTKPDSVQSYDETNDSGETNNLQVYDSFLKFPYDDMIFINEETFAIIKEVYDKFDFYSEFKHGNLDVYSDFKKKYGLLLENKIPFKNVKTSEVVYLKEFELIQGSDDIKEFTYYYFDIDDDGSPELCISNMNFTYVFKYMVDLDQIIIWCDEMGATWYSINGSKTIRWDREGASHGFYKLNNMGEIEVTLFFFSRERFNRNTQQAEVVYMVTLPKYANQDQNKENELVELIKSNGYYDAGQKMYYFRVSENQYNLLTNNYFKAQDLANENIKNVTYTYDELFGDF